MSGSAQQKEARNEAASVAGQRALARLRPEELYKLLVESVVDYAIFLLDAKGYVLTWNPGARRFKGYEAAEIIGKHFSVFYPQVDLDNGKPSMELIEAARVGRFEDEGWRVRKDGSQFWANVIITALRDKEGNLVGYAKVTRDLTERRRAEEALRQSEERFRLLVEGVADYGIFMLSPEGIVASWNAGAERINGYTTSEIVGRHFSAFYPREEVAAKKPERELEIARAEGSFSEEGWRIRKNGNAFWASVLITAIHDVHGTLLGFSKITRDLTERRESQERAIEDARRIAQMEASDRAKSQFLAAMSHELRTPLNAIGGYADLLKADVAGTLTEQQRTYVNRITRGQQHLLGIINDLLNYSRIEAGRLQYDIGEVRVEEVLDSVSLMMEHSIRVKGLEFVRPPLAPGLCILGDRPKVEQVLINLISNAVKFTDSPGRLTLSAVQSGKTVSISLEDTGRGIPEDKRESVFEPFVQLGRSLTSDNEGAGLGLAISRDLARGMAGNLYVKDGSSGGSRFTLELPAAKPA